LNRQAPQSERIDIGPFTHLPFGSCYKSIYDQEDDEEEDEDYEEDDEIAF
jgi:hypothetical protein